MASQIYKSPKRTKKGHKGRALIFRRQYDYARRKSALYQAKVFYTFGPEHSFISAISALVNTVEKFNAMYQDTLTIRHGLLVLIIKHYVTMHKLESFKPEAIRRYYNLRPVLGFFVDGSRSFRALFADLQRMDFCNPHKHHLLPTTRIKVFSSMFQKELKKLLDTVPE